MSRLIDASDVYSLFDKSGRASLHVADIDLIPRVDAVEVVRCKDCVHYMERVGCGGFVYHQCWVTGHIPNGEHFCSYGERKDND